MFIENIKYTLTTLVVALFSLTFVASCGSAGSADNLRKEFASIGQTEEFQFLAQTVMYQPCMDLLEVCSFSFLVNGEGNLESTKNLARLSLRILSTDEIDYHQARSFWDEMMQTEPRQRYEVLMKQWDDGVPYDQQSLWTGVYNLTMYQLERAALIAELTAWWEVIGRPALATDAEGFSASSWVGQSLSPYLYRQIERLRNKPEIPITWADAQKL